MDCTFGGWLADVGHDCNALFTCVIKVLGIPPPTTSSSLAMSECGDYSKAPVIVLDDGHRACWGGGGRLGLCW